MFAVAIALDAGAIGLVERCPVLNAVAEPPRRQQRIFGKPMGGVAVLPAAAVFERLRQVPVIQANPWLDAGFEHGVDQAIVEFETAMVELDPSLRQQAR